MLKHCLLKCIDSVLGVRDKIGVTLHEVCLVERTWTGETIGDGNRFDKVTPIKPSPGIRDFSHDIRAVSGGAIQQGDILLTSISKNNYDRDFLSAQAKDPLVEKFYRIDDHEYRVVNIVERYVTFDVLVRQTISPKGGI